MRKFFFLLLAIPVLATAQDVKNVVTISRYFPKGDKVTQFETALAAHAKKFHKGDVQWRVYTIESGPDAGGYQVVEGPASWDGLDKRGDISQAHTDDWNKTVQPHLTDKYSNYYLTFRQDLSTAIQGDYTDKIAVRHIYFKPGFYGEMVNMIKELKNTWTASDQFVAVYESSASGEPQFILVDRYKNGLKDRVAANRPSMPTLFASANGGETAWNRYITTFKQAVSSQWGEMLSYKRELSSAQ
ncbi:MAG: hypothetical protein ACO1OO_01700 [Flavisolibacter sp.]